MFIPSQMGSRFETVVTVIYNLISGQIGIIPRLQIYERFHSRNPGFIILLRQGRIPGRLAYYSDRRLYKRDYKLYASTKWSNDSIIIPGVNRYPTGSQRLFLGESSCHVLGTRSLLNLAMLQVSFVQYSKSSARDIRKDGRDRETEQYFRVVDIERH